MAARRVEFARRRPRAEVGRVHGEEALRVRLARVGQALALEHRREDDLDRRARLAEQLRRPHVDRVGALVAHAHKLLRAPREQVGRRPVAKAEARIASAAPRRRPHEVEAVVAEAQRRVAQDAVADRRHEHGFGVARAELGPAESVGGIGEVEAPRGAVRLVERGEHPRRRGVKVFWQGSHRRGGWLCSALGAVEVESGGEESAEKRESTPHCFTCKRATVRRHGLAELHLSEA